MKTTAFILLCVLTILCWMEVYYAAKERDSKMK